jgi:hypothetical protein
MCLTGVWACTRAAKYRCPAGSDLTEKSDERTTSLRVHAQAAAADAVRAFSRGVGAAMSISQQPQPRKSACALRPQRLGAETAMPAQRAYGACLQTGATRNYSHEPVQIYDAHADVPFLEVAQLGGSALG